MYKVKFFPPEHNLAILKIENNHDQSILEIFTEADKLVHSVKYKEGINLIIDYRKAILPEDENLYSYMSSGSNFQCRLNKLVRIIDKQKEIHAKNMKLFQLFYTGEQFLQKTITKYNASAALSAADVKGGDASACIMFLETPLK